MAGRENDRRGRNLPSIGSFGLSDMIRCQSQIRKLSDDASSMEEVAGRVVAHFHRYLADDATGAPSTELVRLYKTHSLGALPAELQDFALSSLGAVDDPKEIKCLTLLATCGTQEAWNDRARSESHKAIPLPSPDVVARSPMIAQLITQFGLKIEAVVDPDPEIVFDLDQKSYNVFHVPEAEGSPYVPAQDFVSRYGIKSALGFGGVLPQGDLFAVILFSNQTIQRSTAEFFQTVALSVKVALLPFIEGPVFNG